MKRKCKHFRNMVIDCILCENNTNCVNGMVTTDGYCANCVYSFENVTRLDKRMLAIEKKL